MRVFGSEPLGEIIAWVDERLAAGDREVSFWVADPDFGAGRHAGEMVEIEGQPRVHRPYRVWVDLADRRELRLRTPERRDGLIRVGLQRLAPDEAPESVEPREKYGVGSAFERISKLEDPNFVIDFGEAVERVGLQAGQRVLDIGINTGDEFELLARAVPDVVSDLRLVGIDHSGSALGRARERFPGANFSFLEADINDIEQIEEEPFDLVISNGTLQSPGIEDRSVLRHLVQRRLTPTGSLILGFPNCRYQDGEVLFGARTKNIRQPELSLLVKNLAFYKRYLQQHHRRVFITGKNDILVTAVPIGAR